MFPGPVGRTNRAGYRRNGGGTRPLLEGAVVQNAAPRVHEGGSGAPTDPALVDGAVQVQLHCRMGLFGGHHAGIGTAGEQGGDRGVQIQPHHTTSFSTRGRFLLSAVVFRVCTYDQQLTIGRERRIWCEIRRFYRYRVAKFLVDGCKTGADEAARSIALHAGGALRRDPRHEIRRFPRR